MNAAWHNGKGPQGSTRVPQRGRPDGDADGGTGGSSRAHLAPPGTSERRPMPATLEHPAIGHDERTDEQLLEAYREGDRASFGALVARYQRELFHFLVRFLGDRAAAEDVFQESFL